MRAFKQEDRAGFTLVELLVVIGIIAVLAAIIFPVLASAKSSGRRAKCQSNLQQIGRAFQLYLSDYSDHYPNTGDPYLWMGRRWRWPLKSYVVLAARHDPNSPDNPNVSVGSTLSILKCPDDETPRSVWDDTSYAYSAAFYHRPEDVDSMTVDSTWNSTVPGPPCVSLSASEVLQPSKKAMVSEWLAYHSDERNAQGQKFTWWEYGGARNYLFADGHVQFLDSRRILPPAIGNSPDINRTRHGAAGRDI